MTEESRNQVFISYSHKDSEWLEKLKINLAPLTRKKLVSVWSDTEIKPGDKWKEQITKALATARVAVLLVSPNFLASDFISDQELPPLLEAERKDGLSIFWIAVSESLYTETEIASYQAANNPSQPLDSLSPSALNKELVKVCKQIKSAITQSRRELWRSRIFISYKRDTEPDETIAMQVFEALRKEHDVFIDKKSILIGDPWPSRIEEELRKSDFFITLLSAKSIHSEMVQGEIGMAYHFAKEQEGHPCILPVRLAYKEPFDYSLGLYLNHINWAFWDKEEDTQQLINDLKRALSDGEFKSSKEPKHGLIEETWDKRLPSPLPSARESQRLPRCPTSNSPPARRPAQCSSSKTAPAIRS